MTRSIIIAGACIAIAVALYFGVFAFFRAEPVTLSSATIEMAPGEAGTANVYVQIINGEVPDVLIGASSAEAQTVEIVGTTGEGGLPIPADSNASLAGDGAHLMMSGIDGSLEEGRLVPIALEFERSGEVTTRAIVGPPADPHAMHRMMATMQSADTAMTAPGEPPPSLEMTVTPGEGGTWLVELTTEHFTFDDASDPPEHVPSHGHGHLYLNGLKLQRVYSENAEIGQLAPGTYIVSVSLNTNTHMPYTDDNGLVSAEATITVE
ncbi:MAG: copper chaperone PCu(A)C [Pseudomonadota bacterium]